MAEPHDLLCPYTGTMHSVACECPTIERARADEREDEQAQREALARLLLDSGDITPAGARLLTRPRNGGRNE